MNNAKDDIYMNVYEPLPKKKANFLTPSGGQADTPHYNKYLSKDIKIDLLST